jgi:hypothetical protein
MIQLNKIGRAFPHHSGAIILANKNSGAFVDTYCPGLSGPTS